MENYMGSYIGIGLVFNNKSNSKKKSALQMILKYFTSKNGKLLNAKFSEDEDGDDWKDIENIKLYEVDNLLNKYYLNINLICDILNKKNVMVRAYYENLNENVSGLLLDFEEQLFMNDYPDEEIGEITNKFINLMADIYNVVEYDYALCDQEAIIEYTLDDIEKAKKKYSVLLIPRNNKMEIIKNSWNIDGLTDRFDTGVKYIQISKPNEFEIPKDENIVVNNKEIQIQCCEEDYNILYKRNNPNKLIIDKDIECPQNIFVVTINMPNGNKYEFAIFNAFLGLTPQILEKDNKTYVACNSKVTIIDLDSFTVIKTIETVCCVDKVSETKEYNLLIIVSEAGLYGIDLGGNIIWYKSTDLIEYWDIKGSIISIQTEENIQKIDIKNGNIIFEEEF